MVVIVGLSQGILGVWGGMLDIILAAVGIHQVSFFTWTRLAGFNANILKISLNGFVKEMGILRGVHLSHFRTSMRQTPQNIPKTFNQY